MRNTDPIATPSEIEVTRTDQPHSHLEGGHRGLLKKANTVHAETLAAGKTEAGYAQQTAGPEAASGEEESLKDFLVRLRGQSSELAAALKRQQAELDRREQQLQQRSIELEKQLRKTRLVMHEKEQSLERMHSEIEHKNQELSGRQARDEQLLAEARKEAESLRKLYLEIEEKHQSLKLREASLLRMQEELAAKENDLAAQRRQLEIEQARITDELEHLRISSQEKLHGEERDLALRRQRLQSAEDLLAQRQQAFESRVQRGTERLEHAQSLQDRMDMEGERKRRALEDEAARKLEELKRREEELEVRSQAVERLREDLTAMHRESLELRLATEELWSQLAGAVAPVTLSQSLMRIRNRLHDDYRLQRDEIDTQKKELLELSARIKQQHDQLALRTTEFRDWMRSQQEHLAKQADQILLHRRQVEQREAEVQEERDAWERQRDEWLRKVQVMLAERERLVIPK